jgi:hypothetical protein
MRRRSCLLALLLACAAFVHAQQPPSARVQRVGDSIQFRGRIDADSATEFLRLSRDPSVRRLVISSAGGLVSPALDIADVVHQRQMDVEVAETCMSSCANYIFPAGRQKILRRAGTVGWHGNMAHVLYLHQTGQGNWSEAAIEEARQLAEREAEFYRRIGVDGFVCWFAKIAPRAVEDFYWLSVEDMLRFGIRDVSVLDAEAPARESPDLRPVVVDWGMIQSTRPAVRGAN